jgi:Zn-dependent protease
MSVSWLAFDDRVIALEEVVSPVFSIHDVNARRDRVVVFSGQFLRSPELVYQEVADRFKTMGYMPILRRDGDRDVVMAYPAPALRGRSRRWVHVTLFVLTVITTLWAGTVQALGAFPSPSEFLTHWTAGLPFTVALLGILGVHEFGHYFVARYHGLDVSLPYFIPFPLNPFTGTLGAVIRIQSPFESKKSLFDVGIAGPLAGLAIAIPVVLLGLTRAELVAVQAGAGTATFAEPLLFQWLSRLVVGPRPEGTDLLMNPLLMAGWLGFLITAINLVPVSQLDGGHIAYSILGRYYKVFAWTVFALIALRTLIWNQTFLLMVIFIFLMGIDHPPALNDLTGIGRPRVLLGVLTLLFGLTLITLNPFSTGALVLAP